MPVDGDRGGWESRVTTGAGVAGSPASSGPGAGAAGRWSRRDFLIRLTAASAVVVVPGLAGCQARWPGEFARDKSGGTHPVSMTFDIGVAPFDALATVGAALAVEAGTLRFLLIRHSAAEVRALDRICTHQGCDMTPEPGKDDFCWGLWNSAARELTCSWHGSRFDIDGKVLAGPAPRALERYPVAFDASTGVGTVDFTGGVA